MPTNPFIEWLRNVVADEVVISRTDIDAEAIGNMWSFSITQEQAACISCADVESFIEAVVAQRSRHLSSRKSPPMLFYCWHDEMAAQLRFSLVSEVHDRLPFRCKIEKACLRTIAASFLRSPCREGIPFSELREARLTDRPANKPAEEFVQSVWVAPLPSTSARNHHPPSPTHRQHSTAPPRAPVSSSSRRHPNHFVCRNSHSPAE